MSVDIDKIKPGDRVRVRYRGLEGWQTVTKNGQILWLQEARDWLGEAEILEHKPQIKFQVGDKVRIEGDYDILFGYEGYVTYSEDVWVSINDKYDIHVKDIVLVAKVVRRRG